jgi:hypothetical protein
MLGGAAVSVSLPFLNCFLNDSGTALAAGNPMPRRFATWFWGCGMDAKVFTPTTFGSGWELQPEMAALAPVKKYINLMSNFNAYHGSAPAFVHLTGWVCARTGMVPQSDADRPGETYDVTVAKIIGRTTRFQSLTTTASGDARTTFSYQGQNTPNPADYSPLQLYTRLFGPDFQDPNAPNFKPDPRVMVRRSVLSGVMDDTRSLTRRVGAEDRARLDQYFTGLRALEQQFDQLLTKPRPIAGCERPDAPGDSPDGYAAVDVATRHKMMTDLLVMAVACDQTRVFNMAYSDAKSQVIKTGFDLPHHPDTHMEPIDKALGYQKMVSWFTRRAMDSLSYFIQALANVKEGGGTLLDNCLVVAGTDHSLARIHSLVGIPVITAGSAGGRMKTGIHVDGKGTTIARVGYTALRAMGYDGSSWGTDDNKTSQPVSEVLA